MKSSCIAHPENEPLIIIRKWQLEFCDGNATAAALMSFFEYWHNIKQGQRKQNKKLNAVATAHGDSDNADTSVYQWHTQEEIIEALLGVSSSKNTINKGIDLLVEKGVISIHKNPNPRYKFDNTRHFLFYPEVASQWLNSRQVNNEQSLVNNDRLSVKKDGPPVHNDRMSPETSSEITSEITPNGGSNLDYLSHIASHQPVKPTVVEPSEFDKHFGQYRDAVLEIHNQEFEIHLNQGKQSELIELSREPAFDLELFKEYAHNYNLHGGNPYDVAKFVGGYRQYVHNRDIREALYNAHQQPKQSNEPVEYIIDPDTNEIVGTW